MTDNTIPADKVQEIIEAMGRSLALPSETDNDLGHDDATQRWQRSLEALLPAPPTLADELREFAESLLAGASVSDVELQLIRFADRVETLEQEHEELTYEREESRAAVDNWTITARRLEEALAEIARLRARDNDDSPTPGPGCPTHLETLEEYQNAPAGTIVQMEVPGWAHFIKDDEGCWATKGFIGYYTSESMSGTPCVVVEWGSEPVETPEPERIDPKTCGQYDWYLIEVGGDECHGIRIDPTDRVYEWGFISPDGRFTFGGDDDVRPIRKLTSEEMDAR